MFINEFEESKYLNDVQNFLSNYSFIWVVKTFKQKVLSLKKVYSKYFLLSTFIQKGLQKFIKSLPNWIQIPTSIHFPSLYCHQSIFVPRMTIEISSYHSINLPLFLFNLLHLPKCYSSRVKVIPSCEAQ
jgi:hypothetical protein